MLTETHTHPALPRGSAGALGGKSTRYPGSVCQGPALVSGIREVSPRGHIYDEGEQLVRKGRQRAFQAEGAGPEQEEAWK